MRIGLLGGTFDPVHVGHVSIAARTRHELNLDSVLLIPTAQPPHKPGAPIADAAHRLEMVRIAVEDTEGLEAGDMEIKRGGVSYTIDTVRQVRAIFPGCTVVLIIGADMLSELHAWKEVEALLREVEPAVVPRPGFDVSYARGRAAAGLHEGLLREVASSVVDIGEPVEYSATEIRRRLAAGESVAGMLHPRVLEYVRRHGLYGASG